METLHGFPILIAGPRFSVVEMPDCWAIMDGLDPFPRAVFRYQKDDDGWREAAGQVQRCNSPSAPAPTMPSGASTARVRNSRRQFSIPRIGIFLSSVLLGVSAYLPWAVIRSPATAHGPASTVHGTLFQVLFHGWRRGIATALVVLAVFCALQALLFSFQRIKLVAFLVGVVAVGLTVIAITQVHLFTGGVQQPSATIGYGSYVALGSCALLILSWALFPSRLRKSPAVPIDPLNGYQAPTTFPGTDNGVAPNGPTGSAANGRGAHSRTPDGPRRPTPAQPGGPVHFTGLPALGSALAQLSGQQATQADPSGAVPSTLDPSGSGSTLPGRAPDPVPPTPPPGWYPDPSDVTLQRYWDGLQWSAHTAPR